MNAPLKAFGAIAATALLASCGQGGEAQAVDSTTTTAAAPTPVATAAAPTLAPDSACAEFEGLLRRFPALRVERVPATRLDSALANPSIEGGDRAACRTTAYGRNAGTDPGAVPYTSARDAGWTEQNEVGSQPDSTSYALVRRDVICRFVHTLGFIDESGDQPVERDTIEVRVACARLIPSDTAPNGWAAKQ